MTTTKHLDTAIAMVVEDVRRSYPELSTGEAVAHAYNTVSLDDLNNDDPDASHAEKALDVAYRIVIEWMAS